MKAKEIRQISRKDREDKLKDLKLELVKSQSSGSKTGNSKSKEIKKMIARILTLNASEKEILKNK